MLHLVSTGPISLALSKILHLFEKFYPSATLGNIIGTVELEIAIYGLAISLQMYGCTEHIESARFPIQHSSEGTVKKNVDI